jgi:hypothetical protein
MDDPFAEYHRSQHPTRRRLVRLIAAGAIVAASGLAALMLALAAAFSGWCDDSNSCAQPSSASTGTELVVAAALLVLPLVGAGRMAVGGDAAAALGWRRLGALSLLLLPSYPFVALGVGAVSKLVSLDLVSGLIPAALLFAVYLAAWSWFAEGLARRRSSG